MIRKPPHPAPSSEDIQRFKTLYAASCTEFLAAVQSGVPAASIAELAVALDLPLATLSEALDVPSSTARRKAKNDEVLSPSQGERVLGLQKLIGQIQLMVEQGGDPTGFDVFGWTGQWLSRRVPALGGEYPIQYLRTIAGQAALSDLLTRNISGTYS